MTRDGDGTWTRPIETSYAGCDFRSRLEARWAIFFDVLGVAWDYEPQGFETGPHRWLPDFRLTDTGTWVEVKGHIDDLVKHADRYAAFVDQLADPILVLGPIPRPDGPRAWHWIYHGLAGAITRSPAWFEPSTPHLHINHQLTAEPSPSLPLGAWPIGERTRPVSDLDLTPHANDPHQPWHSPVWLAYNAARRARFEHGQTPKVGRRTVGPNGLSTDPGVKKPKTRRPSHPGVRS